MSLPAADTLDLFEQIRQRPHRERYGWSCALTRTTAEVWAPDDITPPGCREPTATAFYANHENPAAALRHALQVATERAGSD